MSCTFRVVYMVRVFGLWNIFFIVGRGIWERERERENDVFVKHKMSPIGANCKDSQGHKGTDTSWNILSQEMFMYMYDMKTLIPVFII